MNPIIVIKSSTDGISAPSREVLCSVWPVSQDGKELIVGDPIFSNHMVSVGVSNLEEPASILELPQAGTYLLDVGYSNGQSLRTTISISEGQKYLLEVEAPKQIPSMSYNKENAHERLSVRSAAPKRMDPKKMALEVSVITQPNQLPLSELYEFVLNLKSTAEHKENILRCPLSTELTRELSLSIQPMEQPSEIYNTSERKWITVGIEEKPQILLAYPYGWICDHHPQFKLMMERRIREGKSDNQWSASLKLMDPVYGSLVEYLTRRDLFSSLSISESERGKATTALYKKVGNPFSAAAAAYMFALTGREESRHYSWMEALSSRYTWLPDGAIALGWITLREGQSDLIAWEKAKKLFSLACSRGLPYYTVGLHILVDALTLLKRLDPDDDETLKMLAAAKAADVACVRTEPFTTLQIPRYLGLPMRRT